MKLFLTILLFSTQLLVLAQQPTADSLEKIINRDLPQNQKVKASNALAHHIQDGETALATIRKTVKEAKDTNDALLLSEAYASYGKLIEQHRYNYDSIIFYYDLALSYLDSEKYPDKIAAIYDDYCSTLINADRHPEAIEKYLFNLSYYESISDTQAIADTYNKIANSNNYLGYHDIALKYYELALQKFESIEDRLGMGRVHANMSIIYSEELDLEKLNYHSQLAIKNYKIAGDEKRLASHYTNMVGDFIFFDIPDSANHYLRLAKEIYNQVPLNSTEKGFFYQFEGIYYNHIGNYAAAVEAHQKSLDIGYAIGNTQLIINNHLYLSRVYEKIEDFEKAYINYKIQNEISDSLFNLSSTQLIAEIQSKYDNVKQAAENEQLRAAAELSAATIQKQKIYNTSFAIILFILVCSGSVLLIAYRKIVRQKTKAIEDGATIKLQAEKLKKNDAIKSQFFSNISHELRTPLTILLGMLNHLGNNKDRFLAKEDVEKIEIAKKNGAKIQELIDEVFELTKMEAHKIIINPKPIMILPLIERIVFSFHSLADEKKQDLTISYNQVHNIFLNLDEAKFEKVMNNLIINALKFTPEKGKIAIMLSLHDSGKFLDIKVSDNGDGIPSGDLPHIFDRYFQSENGSTNANPGIGIGLSMAKELTEMHGGKITVESKPKKGATFTLSFPVMTTNIISKETKTKLTKALPRRETLAEAPIPAKHSLMIVEDNPDMREYLEIVFREHFSLVMSQDGEDAMQKLESEQPDLIISDLMMPKMDGHSLLKKLKEDEKFKLIPVVILTAKLGEEDKLDALRLGVDDYLTKPFSATEILIKVNNLLKNAKARKEWKLKPDEVEDIDLHTDAFLQRIKSFVEENIRNSAMNISSVADHMAVSERQLYRKVGAMTGLTPNQLIREVKLKYAMELLKKNSATKVASLAKEVGFESSAHFSKLFYERFGKKPSEFIATFQV